MAESPISQVQESMNEFFSRDPLSLTDEDIDRMKIILNRDQALYTQKPSGRKKIEAPLNLKLEDLDLDKL